MNDFFESQIEVIFKLHLPSGRDHFWQLSHASDMHFALQLISQECRSVIKHGDNEAVAEFAQRIKDLIYDVENSGNL